MLDVPLELHPTRFPPDLWAALTREAKLQGVSVSELVRIASASYVAWCIARRDDQATDALATVIEAARQFAARYPV